MDDATRTEAHVPVDLLNPGQVFACQGLLEAADVLCGDAEGYFDWSDASEVRFRIRANGAHSPVERVLRFLDRAEARAEVVEGSPNIEAWNDAWGPSPTVVPTAAGYPFPDPRAPATLVCALVAGVERLTLDYWGDRTGRDNVKFWAGSGGLPGAALARRMLETVQGHTLAAREAPFLLARPLSSSFRFDWRRDYIPIDLGFSLNEHKSTMSAIGYPVVEILAAVGMSHARPRRPNPRDKLAYLYAVLGCSSSTSAIWMPPQFHRVALGAASLPFPIRRFRMRLGSPGKDDRAITTVTEESTS